MIWLTDSFEAIRDFMELGGPVLRWIAVTIFLMWVLIIERVLYFRAPMRQMAREVMDNWEGRPERRSWAAHQIRELMISRFSMATNKGIPVIQTLVALCPLSSAWPARYRYGHDQRFPGHGGFGLRKRSRHGGGCLASNHPDNGRHGRCSVRCSAGYDTQPSGSS